MKLGAIIQHPHSKMYLALDVEQCQPIDANFTVLSRTNIDVSKLGNSSFDNLADLGEVMNETTLAQALKHLGENNTFNDLLESFKDKFEMCHRGLVPVYLYISNYDCISVLSFSDENPDKFHITRLFKSGDVFLHSFEAQDEDIHYVYPKFFLNL